ncbi:MAG TPA: UDP-N-acetylmuramoyl-L-alanyl-D-glutamate--2,6-diaminopimelate ligase, partial [Pirellulales bacterium]|nr:UDP-N-acetylmuramoyl-L-alanyl-D-glutamate--2,6-diaminopimelate ligase [Pirellulales bacterium]
MRSNSAQTKQISLRQVLRDAEVIGSDDVRVTSICADSRRCEPGDLFAALPGYRVDGHDFVHEAVRRGASAVLAHHPVGDLGVPVAYVTDTRPAYARLCQALVDDPGRRLKLIGVTGTNGKTTTSWLIASILARAGLRPGVLGTLGYCDGSELSPAQWTTPPAPVMAAWMHRMVEANRSHVVMEVSSHALAQHRVDGLEFDVACVTNVRHDHLDYHRTPHQYRAAKARLLESIRPGGFAVLNADDDVCAEWLGRTNAASLSVGLESDAQVTATLLEQHASEQTFLLHAGDETAAVHTHLIGRHNLYNCLTAAAAGLGLGIDLTTVARGLETVNRLPGRLERIECGQPFNVFVDYAHTADALAGVLDTLRDVTAGRVICVFGAGGDRDSTKRPKMGRAVEARADLAIVTSDNPRTESQRRITRDILRGCVEPLAIELIDNRAAAIEWALSQARPGDSVLIAGKGHETEQIVGTERFE